MCCIAHVSCLILKRETNLLRITQPASAVARFLGWNGLLCAESYWRIDALTARLTCGKRQLAEAAESDDLASSAGITCYRI